MARLIEQGFEKYNKFIDTLTEKKRHELTVVNAMEYALYLQNRHGMYVFNNAEMLRFARKHFEILTKSGVPATDEAIQRTLEAAAIEYINYLRSTTHELRPPAKKGEGLRAAHPGGWADITGNLNRAYWFLVDDRRFNL